MVGKEIKYERERLLEVDKEIRKYTAYVTTSSNY